MTYAGFPSIPNLTAITPRITVSRTSGTAPCSVYVTAAESEATFSDGGAAFATLRGTAFDPWAHLEWSWDFGDASGAETFTDYGSGAQPTINANDGQVGPDAAYVYRTAGTYTITLTGRGKLPNGTYVTASTTTLLLQGWHQVQLKNAVGSNAHPTGGYWTLTVNGVTTGAIAPDCYPELPATAITNGDIYNVPARGGDGTSGNPYNSLQLAIDNAIGAGKMWVCCDESSRFFVIFPVGSWRSQSLATFTADASNLTGSAPEVRIVRHEDAGSAAAVTVSAFSGTERYFDSTYDGSNGASDGTITRPYTDLSTLGSWMQSTGTLNKRANLKRGSTFTRTSPLYFYGTTGQIVAYGTGAKPIIDATSSTTIIGDVSYTQTLRDFVISGIDLRTTMTSGRSTMRMLGPGTGNDGVGRNWPDPRDVLIDGCTISGGAPQLYVVTGRGLVVWGCDFSQLAGTIVGIGNQAMFTGSRWGHAIVGCSFSGGDADATRDHHTYLNTERNMVLRWCEFGEAPSRNFCVKASVHNRSEFGRGCHYLTVDSCDVSGTNNGLGPGLHTDWSGNGGQDARYIGVIISRCRIHDLGGYGSAAYIAGTGETYVQGYGIYTSTLDRLEIRDCEFWNLPFAEMHRMTVGDFSRCRTKAYRPANARTERSASVSGAGGYIYGNAWHVATAYDSAQGIIEYDSATLASWEIDGNQYYAPAHATPRLWRDDTGGGSKTFAEWQALGQDAGGTYADPGWPDPANGDFGSGTPDGDRHMQFETALRTALATTIETNVGTSPVLECFTGSAPAATTDADTGTKLYSITCPSDWATQSSGALSKSGTWQDTSADAAGTPGHYRLKTSGATVKIQGTAGVSSGELSHDTTVTLGGTVTVSTFTITVGNS